MKKGGSELLHANYAACTNFQNNTTLQLAPTPLNSMSALRSQNNTPCLANLSFYSLFSSYANDHYSHIRSPQTHIPLFFFSQRSNADAMWVIYSITF